ncbi:hypothetical protein [Neotamlana laminarinivorans]|uniref:STAS/SEC14 domain-containing protein n=1 Tax=Neotamlana laminarinivorans TaxID=2883124 RepID=A0A9X1HZJ3_9FLAO|nr:hypothetical protein [Tamlana laminarinivorans]MCB4797402.1 hypothetical protein [Tamlana laminarinivorans]
MIKALNLEIGTVKIYKSYLIVEINEGETITETSNNILIDIADAYYPTKPFVYISNRINSYAVNPVVYTKTSQIPNLAGFSVVSSNNLSLNNAEVEKLFVNKPFEIFTDLNEAIIWAENIVTNYNKSL